jgi:chromosome partitioning protein
VAIITLATTKGGAGKTTIAQVIVRAVHDMGYSLAVIDGDVNATLSDWLANTEKLDVECHRIQDESQIVPTANALQRRHDLVVIDTAGAPSQATVFAIGCSSLVLIPVQISNGDVVEAVKTYNVLQSAAEMVQRRIEGRVVFTDYTPKTKVAKHVRKLVRKAGLPAMETRLHRLVAFKELTFNGTMPRSGTAAAQARLFVEELREMGCLPFLEDAPRAAAPRRTAEAPLHRHATYA